MLRRWLSYIPYLVTQLISTLDYICCISKCIYLTSICISLSLLIWGTFKKILDNFESTVVNDCGCNDRILLLSEALVPNTGMAGRVGFHGLNNDRFVNRFFKGGHSHYFDKSDSFMEKHWLPLFSTPSSLNAIDERTDRILVSGIGEKLISLLGETKEVIYLTLIFLLIFKCFI